MKTLIGRVVSTKMAKTVVIERTISRVHPLYKKKISRERRIKAATSIGLEVGDTVRFEETRPISKDKHFRVIEKITK